MLKHVGKFGHTHFLIFPVRNNKYICVEDDGLIKVKSNCLDNQKLFALRSCKYNAQFVQKHKQNKTKQIYNNHFRPAK